MQTRIDNEHGKRSGWWRSWEIRIKTRSGGNQEKIGDPEVRRSDQKPEIGDPEDRSQERLDRDITHSQLKFIHQSCTLELSLFALLMGQLSPGLSSAFHSLSNVYKLGYVLGPQLFFPGCGMFTSYVYLLGTKRISI